MPEYDYSDTITDAVLEEVWNDEQDWCRGVNRDGDRWTDDDYLWSDPEDYEVQAEEQELLEEERDTEEDALVAAVLRRAERRTQRRLNRRNTGVTGQGYRRDQASRQRRERR